MQMNYSDIKGSSKYHVKVVDPLNASAIFA